MSWTVNQTRDGFGAEHNQGSIETQYGLAAANAPSAGEEPLLGRQVVFAGLRGTMADLNSMIGAVVSLSPDGRAANILVDCAMLIPEENVSFPQERYLVVPDVPLENLIPVAVAEKTLAPSLPSMQPPPGPASGFTQSQVPMTLRLSDACSLEQRGTFRPDDRLKPPVLPQSTTVGSECSFTAAGHWRTLAGPSHTRSHEVKASPAPSPMSDLPRSFPSVYIYEDGELRQIANPIDLIVGATSVEKETTVVKNHTEAKQASSHVPTERMQTHTKKSWRRELPPPPQGPAPAPPDEAHDPEPEPPTEHQSSSPSRGSDHQNSSSADSARAIRAEVKIPNMVQHRHMRQAPQPSIRQELTQLIHNQSVPSSSSSSPAEAVKPAPAEDSWLPVQGRGGRTSSVANTSRCDIDDLHGSSHIAAKLKHQMELDSKRACQQAGKSSSSAAASVPRERARAQKAGKRAGKQAKGATGTKQLASTGEAANIGSVSAAAKVDSDRQQVRHAVWVSVRAGWRSTRQRLGPVLLYLLALLISITVIGIWSCWFIDHESARTLAAWAVLVRQRVAAGIPTLVWPVRTNKGHADESEAAAAAVPAAAVAVIGSPSFEIPVLVPVHRHTAMVPAQSCLTVGGQLRIGPATAAEAWTWTAQYVERLLLRPHAWYAECSDFLQCSSGENVGRCTQKLALVTAKLATASREAARMQEELSPSGSGHGVLLSSGTQMMSKRLFTQAIFNPQYKKISQEAVISRSCRSWDHTWPSQSESDGHLDSLKILSQHIAFDWYLPAGTLCGPFGIAYSASVPATVVSMRISKLGTFLLLLSDPPECSADKSTVITQFEEKAGLKVERFDIMTVHAGDAIALHETNALILRGKKVDTFAWGTIVEDFMDIKQEVGVGRFSLWSVDEAMLKEPPKVVALGVLLEPATRLCNSPTRRAQSLAKRLSKSARYIEQRECKPASFGPTWPCDSAA